MARPKVHYSMVIKNHETEALLKVELVDLFFQESRCFRVRVNGVAGHANCRWPARR